MGQVESAAVLFAINATAQEGESRKTLPTKNQWLIPFDPAAHADETQRLNFLQRLKRKSKDRLSR